MKKSQRMIFHNRDARRGHFHSFAQMKATLSGMMIVGRRVYRQLFQKQSPITKTIINNDCFSRKGLCNTQQKAVMLYFVFV